ncbi:MAG: hypothetical protein VX733_11400 [Candidatus Latescibacterota bacterium]|nr:hypothetical protein [Candidatus Latescibacterota bacterium]
MIEPDRTIMIVSVIGLIVIWGSVAYHKWVQDGAPARGDDDIGVLDDPPKDDPATPAVESSFPAETNTGESKEGTKVKGRRR